LRYERRWDAAARGAHWRSRRDRADHAASVRRTQKTGRRFLDARQIHNRRKPLRFGFRLRQTDDGFAFLPNAAFAHQFHALETLEDIALRTQRTATRFQTAMHRHDKFSPVTS